MTALVAKNDGQRMEIGEAATKAGPYNAEKVPFRSPEGRNEMRFEIEATSKVEPFESA